MTQLEMLRALAPELASISDTQAQAVLSIADNTISKKTFGTDYDSACVLYAAHILTLQNDVANAGSASDVSVSGGDILSEKEGDLSRTYSAGAGTSGTSTAQMLSKTLYGQMLLAMRGRHIVAVTTRMGGPCHAL